MSEHYNVQDLIARLEAMQPDARLHGPGGGVITGIELTQRRPTRLSRPGEPGYVNGIQNHCYDGSKPTTVTIKLSYLGDDRA